MMHPHALFLSYHVGRDENPGNYLVYHIRKMNRMVYLGCSSTEKNRHWPGKTWTLQVPPTPGITSCKIPLDMEVHMVLWIFPWNKTIQLWRYLHDYGTPATEHLSSGFTLAIGRQKTRTLICCSCSSVSSMARTIQGDVSANYRYSIYTYIYISLYIYARTWDWTTTVSSPAAALFPLILMWFGALLTMNSTSTDYLQWSSTIKYCIKICIDIF